jgi:C-terminal processing protease CtpA/Prc
MTLEPNKSLDRRYETDMSGTSLIAEGADFRTFKVVHVLGSSPAAEAGLREEDVITSIDGKTASDLSLAEIRRLFRVNRKKYLLGITRGGQSLQIKLKTKKLV